jgi:hypothetical protein
MLKKNSFALYLLLLAVCTVVVIASPTADASDVSGQWFGTGQSSLFFWQTSNFSLSIFEGAPGLFAATVYVPDLGLFDTLLPVTIDGDNILIGDPSFLAFVGTISDGSIVGDVLVPIPFPPWFDLMNWQAQKDEGVEFLPGTAPGPECNDLPPLYCTGDAEHCSELLPFDPDAGPGYLDYPINFETLENQFRSYLRRDLEQLVKYAAAKVDCKAGDWDYGNFAPVGLGDMSEADGAIPGTSIGSPGHPPGTHEDGRDIDVAYYQLFAIDNLLRPIGVHHDEFNVEANRCVEPPYALDEWRTALFIAYLSEHHRVRVIGVDGEAGLILEDALDELVSMGWIDADLRDSIPLAYELTDTGLGWFLHHHHHLHISMNPVQDLVSSAALSPDVLNHNSNGNYITGLIELIGGYDVSQIDPASVALIIDGHTLLYAEATPSEVSDSDGNGILDLTVKFDRQEVLDALDVGTVELSIVGSVAGEFFQTTDTIIVQ